MTHGTVHWNELNTRDAVGMKEFYEKTLGSTFDSMPMPEGGTYWIMKSGDIPVGGIFDVAGTEFEEFAGTWMTYFAVDDVDTRLKSAVSAGAKVLKEPWDVPGVGRIGLLSQPDGAVVGWMTPSDAPG